MRPEQTSDVLERALQLCPQLAPPEIRSVREPTVEDLLPLIIEEGCGFRPVRKGGVRLEVEWFGTRTGGKVPVVYNYGWVYGSLFPGEMLILPLLSRHGGYGFMCCFAAASIALDLLDGALSNN